MGGQEIASDFVFKQSIAGAFELADFRCAKFDTGVLFVMQLLAALVDALVLEAG